MTYDATQTQEDAYLADRPVSVLVEANRAATTVRIAADLTVEDARLERADVLVAYKRARELARLTGLAIKRAEYTVAVRASEAAQRLADQVVASDARFADIDPDAEWTEPGADRAEEIAVKREAMTGERCEDDPAKLATPSRYRKRGCRCNACKAAVAAQQAAQRAKKEAA